MSNNASNSNHLESILGESDAVTSAQNAEIFDLIEANVLVPDVYHKERIKANLSVETSKSFFPFKRLIWQSGLALTSGCVIFAMIALSKSGSISSPEIAYSVGASEPFAGADTATVSPDSRVSIGREDAIMPNRPSYSPSVGQPLARTGFIGLTVDSVLKSSRDIESITRTIRGRVISSNFRKSAGVEYSDIFLEVPATSFDGTMSSIGLLGEIQSQSISGEDISTPLTAVRGQIQGLKQQMEDLRQELAKIPSKETGRAAQIKRQLERIRAQINDLSVSEKALVARETYYQITVNLQSRMPWYLGLQNIVSGPVEAALGVLAFLLVLSPFAIFGFAILKRRV